MPIPPFPSKGTPVVGLLVDRIVDGHGGHRDSGFSADAGVSAAKRTGNSVACLDNLRQLQLGALVYAGDHNDFLPPNGWAQVEWSDGCPQGYASTDGSWVLGNAPVETTESGIRNGVLFPYVKAAACYHCPLDKSKVDGTLIPRKRSCSASYYMNGSKDKGYAQVKAKSSEINDPSNKFVFLDEHENSIDDGFFFTHVPGEMGEQDESHDDPANHYAGAHWRNMPTGRHNKGCNLSYADESTRYRKWLWPKKLLSPDASRAPVNDLDFRDLRWLQAGIPDISFQLQVAAGSNGKGHP